MRIAGVDPDANATLAILALGQALAEGECQGFEPGLIMQLVVPASEGREKLIGKGFAILAGEISMAVHFLLGRHTGSVVAVSKQGIAFPGEPAIWAFADHSMMIAALEACRTWAMEQDVCISEG